MNLIEVENLKKTYPDGTRALRGISLAVSPGEFVAIMGPSGSGKSTLLHMLGFLDEPTAGDYFFLGKEYRSYGGDERARIRNEKMGFVFQMFNLLARTSVLENVQLPLLYSHTPDSLWERKARDALLSVGLSHRLLHEPSELSGGEKQRVAIARALVNSPQIIFADEPTGNLDSQSGAVVMDILQRLNDEGRTVLLITHETYTAEHAARIVRLRDGAVESDREVNHRRRSNGTLEK